MQFELKKSGTITDCREAMNTVLQQFPSPETHEQRSIRAVFNQVVEDYLDPRHDEWAAQVQSVRAANVPRNQGGQEAQLKEPEEPKASIDISIHVSYGA
jgi:hypothetical protein